jgi:hypothetical protein
VEEQKEDSEKKKKKNWLLKPFLCVMEKGCDFSLFL